MFRKNNQEDYDQEQPQGFDPRLIGIGAAVLVVLYLIGLLAQYAGSGASNNAGWGVVERKISFNPVVSIFKAFTTSLGIRGIILAAGAVILFFFFRYFNRDDEKNMDERNFKHSDLGTYGTSGWMTDEELEKILFRGSIEETTGTIFGTYKGDVISLPVESRLNKHVAVYGASGTGKSRSFVRNQILQCALREESVIVTDPKGEMYADTAIFLKKQGYNVKVFNLVNPATSDAWNCLGEITVNEEQVELMAQTFCDVIIRNTAGASPDHFWDNAEMNLLKALCLYVALDESRPAEQKSIGAVYEMLATSNYDKLNEKFSLLDVSHPAQAPWNIYNKAGDTVRGNIIIGLGSRLQVFQSDIIKKITQYNEIDMEAPAREKCAYFVIISDQDATLSFLSSLFFSFLFIRLVRYADIYGTDGKTDVPVNFILDEFPNIGEIPDFTKKLSTIRSRDLRVAVIFQNLAQLKNRYPLGLWEEILGNCDSQLFLGATDSTTATFISERTGEITIEVESTAVQRKSITVADTIPEYRQTKSVGKRYLYTPDEVLRLDNKYALLIIRGQKTLKLEKFDFTKHPGHLQFEPAYIRDYMPKWRQEIIDKQNEKKKREEEEDKRNMGDEGIPLADKEDKTKYVPKGVNIIDPTKMVSEEKKTKEGSKEGVKVKKKVIGVDGKAKTTFNMSNKDHLNF